MEKIDTIIYLMKIIKDYENIKKKLSSKKQKKMNNLLIKNQLVSIEWKLK